MRGAWDRKDFSRQLMTRRCWRLFHRAKDVSHTGRCILYAPFEAQRFVRGNGSKDEFGVPVPDQDAAAMDTLGLITDDWQQEWREDPETVAAFLTALDNEVDEPHRLGSKKAAAARVQTLADAHSMLLHLYKFVGGSRGSGAVKRTESFGDECFPQLRLLWADKTLVVLVPSNPKLLKRVQEKRMDQDQDLGDSSELNNSGSDEPEQELSTEARMAQLDRLLDSEVRDIPSGSDDDCDSVAEAQKLPESKSESSSSNADSAAAEHDLSMLPEDE